MTRRPALVLALLSVVSFGWAGLAGAQGDPATTDPADAAASSDSRNQGLPLLVDVELSPPAITVGDRVEATVMVVWMGEDVQEPARFPTWQDTWGRAEILEVQEPNEIDDASGRRIWRQQLTLTAFRTGKVELPPVTVALPLSDRTIEATTESVTFTVGSVLPEPPEAPPGQAAGQGQGQADQPPPIPAPKGPAGAIGLHQTQQTFWLTTIALWLALLVGLVWTTVAVANQPERVAAESKTVDPLRLLAPLDELRERLARLDPASDAEPLHTGLSFALRTYLGRSLHFRAVESTTTEIQRALRRASLSADVHHRVVRLLRNSDAVKFARADVSPDVAGRRIAEAGDLARQIEHEMAPTVVSNSGPDPAPSQPVHDATAQADSRRAA